MSQVLLKSHFKTNHIYDNNVVNAKNYINHIINNLTVEPTWGDHVQRKTEVGMITGWV